MARFALVVIDMLNPYEHQDAERLGRRVAGITGPLAGLVARARERDDVELVYVNDNYGDFAADRHEIEERALKGRRPDLVEPILPPPECAFLSKVRHSAFFGTALEYLLSQTRVETVVLTGQVTEQCVLYSALDAYVRHYALVVPPDCVAAIHEDLGQAALRMMERNMSAHLTLSGDCLTR
ncbi:cysteine hydrolase family protein [Nonomuraea jiangxiensis]|uniref:Nicotinamidase-related amidase n=1 Tax=Nonomuraea jiangxiensis TaxID=633440 RepID=A0A1G9J5A9_9ACTN|nr:isochorismatase family cysteine hydrolase [Nonomuraea jiangxiensis]SDL32334.1 Nicotinamidase-related amidase [Nonomuraea jiangxiensis]